MKYLAMLLLMTGCTVNLQNIDTHGTASEVADDTATPTVDMQAEMHDM